MRRAVLLVTPLLLVAACGGSPDKAEKTPTTASCPGGDIRFLQGQPTQLPGGGSAGIGQVFDTHPPTVGLAIGSKDAQAKPQLAVGDSFVVEGTTYRITCISRSKVTAQQAS